MFVDLEAQQSEAGQFALVIAAAVGSSGVHFAVVAENHFGISDTFADQPFSVVLSWHNWQH